jgi:hypothetical protein
MTNTKSNMFFKTIFISDIGGKHETVLPYALSFTKHISNNLSIIHAVDPQKQPAISSAYADSQSFEVGSKLSKHQIIDRELHKADLLIEKKLSKEASKLNFPLRINTIVEAGSLGEKLSEELNADALSLIMIGANLEGTILHDLDEFFEITKQFKNISLIIPPEFEFTVPEKVFVLYDFESNIHNEIYNVINALEAFNPLINVADVVEHQNDLKYIEMEIKSAAWLQQAGKFVASNPRLTSNILSGKHYSETVLNFIQRNNYDLVAIPKNMKDSINSNIFSKQISKQLINRLETPVILY